MWRSIIIALALICLGLLGWYAVRKYPPRIEGALQARAQKVLDTQVPGVIVKISQRDALLGGSVASERERKTAEALVADLSGIKSVKSEISVSSQPPTPPPEPPKEAALALDITWSGTSLSLTGEVPRALVGALDQKLANAFDAKAVKVERSFKTTEGSALAEGGPVVTAALEALALALDGQAKVRGGALNVVATVADEASEGKLRAVVERAGGDAKVTVRQAVAADAADAGAAAEVAAAEVVADTGPAEVAAPDAGPAEVAAPDTVKADTGPATADASPVVDPGGSLTPAQCKALIAAAVEGDKRITFIGPTGRISEEGDKKVQEVAAYLARCPTATGVIEGYHDDYGEPDRLKVLTQIRAYNVHKRLADLGVDPKRFKYVGLGYRNLRYPTNRNAERVLNQRIEFNITVE